MKTLIYSKAGLNDIATDSLLSLQPFYKVLFLQIMQLQSEFHHYNGQFSVLLDLGYEM